MSQKIFSLLRISSLILAVSRLLWKPKGFHVKLPIRIRMAHTPVTSTLNLSINLKFMSAI